MSPVISRTVHLMMTLPQIPPRTLPEYPPKILFENLRFPAIPRQPVQLPYSSPRSSQIESTSSVLMFIYTVQTLASPSGQLQSTPVDCNRTPCSLVQQRFDVLIKRRISQRILPEILRKLSQVFLNISPGYSFEDFSRNSSNTFFHEIPLKTRPKISSNISSANPLRMFSRILPKI